MDAHFCQTRTEASFKAALCHKSEEDREDLGFHLVQSLGKKASKNSFSESIHPKSAVLS